MSLLDDARKESSHLMKEVQTGIPNNRRAGIARRRSETRRKRFEYSQGYGAAGCHQYRKRPEFPKRGRLLEARVWLHDGLAAREGTARNISKLKRYTIETLIQTEFAATVTRRGVTARTTA
jgi:hypothetical protein